MGDLLGVSTAATPSMSESFARIRDGVERRIRMQLDLRLCWG
jgi:hypothetical protein